MWTSSPLITGCDTLDAVRNKSPKVTPVFWESPAVALCMWVLPPADLFRKRSVHLEEQKIENGCTISTADTHGASALSDIGLCWPLIHASGGCWPVIMLPVSPWPPPPPPPPDPPSKLPKASHPHAVTEQWRHYANSLSFQSIYFRMLLMSTMFFWRCQQAGIKTT